MKRLRKKNTVKQNYSKCNYKVKAAVDKLANCEI